MGLYRIGSIKFVVQKIFLFILIRKLKQFNSDKFNSANY